MGNFGVLTGFSRGLTTWRVTAGDFRIGRGFGGEEIRHQLAEIGGDVRNEGGGCRLPWRRRGGQGENKQQQGQKSDLRRKKMSHGETFPGRGRRAGKMPADAVTLPEGYVLSGWGNSRQHEEARVTAPSRVGQAYSEIAQAAVQGSPNWDQPKNSHALAPSRALPARFELPLRRLGECHKRMIQQLRE